MMDETFVCESCGQRLDLDDGCEHDWYTVHNWCRGCCEDSGWAEENKEPHMDWNDLD